MSLYKEMQKALEAKRNKRAKTYNNTTKRTAVKWKQKGISGMAVYADGTKQ